MSVAFTVLLVLAAIAILAVVYITLSINFVASHQDRVHTVPPIATERDAFMRALHGSAGEAPTEGNEVILLQNGDGIFPPMLAAIRASRSTVHFSCYIMWTGSIADRFVEAFVDAARRGVIVRIVLDSEGSAGSLDPSVVQRLRDGGCQFAWYRRAVWYDVTQYNRRTHRRLLIVDGVVGFTGGAGVADEWLGDARDSSQWRDTHVHVTGPAVEGLQAGFTDSWNQCTSELLLDARDYPLLGSSGGMTVTTVISTPAGGSSPAQRVMAALIDGAARSLRITTAYFLPTPAFVDALCAARQRGVDVTIIVPGRYHDKPMVRRASRHTWPALLASGVRIHEYERSMIHAKTLTVDGELLLVGSINFDPRSFSLNAECGIVVADRGMAREMEEVFDDDLTRCRPVESTSIAELPAIVRLGDGFLYWWRGQF